MNDYPIPIQDRIAMVRDTSTEEKVGSLYIPQSAEDSNEAVLRYRVVAVGPGLWSVNGDKRCPLSVKVGDTVWCNKPPEFRTYKWRGEDVTVINEGDVLGHLPARNDA